MFVNLIAATLATALGTAPIGPVPETIVLGARTVRVLPAPVYLEGTPVGALHSPDETATLDNALRHEVLTSLARRGYLPAGSDADLVVTCYLTTPASGDVTDWAHLYPWRPLWLRAEGAGSVDLTPAEYAEGAVVIDLVDARTDELVWRGHAVAPPTGDALIYSRHLKDTVRQLVGQFPVPVAPVE